MSTPVPTPDTPKNRAGSLALPSSAYTLEKTSKPLYFFFQFMLIIFYRLYFRASFRGARNMPRSGPVLIVANHASDLDPPLLGAVLPRHVCFMGKTELFQHWPLSFILPRLGVVPVNRGAGDRAAIRLCLEVLRGGNALLIFPEGTRSRDGKLQQAQLGASMILSQMPEVPVLPVRIEGTFEAMGHGKHFPRPHKIRVVVGKPFHLSELNHLPEVKSSCTTLWVPR